MKRALAIWFGLVAVILAWLPAKAADLSPRYYGQPVAPVAPVYYPPYWTGFYLGINGGGGWGQSQWDGLNRFNISGGLIGATIGYNWQFNRIVVGAEGDIDWSAISGTTTVYCPQGCSTRSHWLATVRGRVGYAFNRFMPYLTAGLAVGDISASLAGFLHKISGIDPASFFPRIV